MKQAIVIGSGFAGLSAACFLAKAGVDVTVLERHDTPGGRARSFTARGFTYDMGPSWYWMPGVFEKFFAAFGKTPADYYTLRRLDPSYQVFWPEGITQAPASMPALEDLFEQEEEGAGKKLREFLREAGFKYNTAMESLVYEPGNSPMEFLRKDVLSSVFRLDILQSMHRHVRRYFKSPKLQQLMEFPILFLGALPRNTPALYSLMNYADMQLGTWYPMGGMVQIIYGMKQLAESLGVQFRFGESVTAINADGHKVTGITTDKNHYEPDITIAACDYHHAESLLPAAFRNYDERYWESRAMAPSCLLYYLGFDKKLTGLQHHNLFFDAPFDAHAAELYTTPRWPSEPLMYVCCPSKTDDSVAPAGCENLFVLIPVAPGLQDDESIRKRYVEIALQRLEHRLGLPLRDSLIYQRSYAGTDFSHDYSAYKGNAYGLANTLRQTAFLKPALRNKKLKNLFYAGQLTVPGPGVPPAIISGEIAATQALRYFQPKTASL